MWRRSVSLAFVLLVALAGCFHPDPAPPSGRTPFQVDEPGQQRINDVNIATLTNGLTVIHRHTTANSVVGIQAAVRMGSAQEDRERAGQTALLMNTLVKGTRNRDSETIAEELAALGTDLASSAGRDFSTVSLRAVPGDLPAALEILADVLFDPIFPHDHVRLEREMLLAEIRMMEDQLAGFAWRRFREAIFGGHPYGMPLKGTPETLAGLSPIDLGGVHRDFFVPSNMILTVVGDVDNARLLRAVEEHFGGVTLERNPRYQVDKVVAPGGALLDFDKDSEQGYVILGHLVCPEGHRDQAAVEVASAILGGGMSSRLFADLRDRKGLAYSLGSTAVFHQSQGLFAVYIGTNGETLDRWFPAADAGGTVPATDNELWDHLVALRDEPVGAEELERARNYIAGAYLRQHESNLQQAAFLTHWHLTGLGVDHDEEYLERVRAVTARDVMRVANKYFVDPTVVVVRPLRRGGG